MGLGQAAPFLLKEGFEPRDLLISLRHRPTQADELQLGFCQLVTGTPESRQFLILLQELSIEVTEASGLRINGTDPTARPGEFVLQRGGLRCELLFPLPGGCEGIGQLLAFPLKRRNTGIAVVNRRRGGVRRHLHLIVETGRCIIGSRGLLQIGACTEHRRTHPHRSHHKNFHGILLLQVNCSGFLDRLLTLTQGSEIALFKGYIL